MAEAILLRPGEPKIVGRDAEPGRNYLTYIHPKVRFVNQQEEWRDARHRDAERF
jgi:hypothetical protein